MSLNMSPAKSIIEVDVQHAEREPVEALPSDPAIGKWYWMEVEDYPEDDASKYGRGDRQVQRQLLCVVKMGTNYAEMENVRRHSWRVHFKDFEAKCTYEPNHRVLIAARIEGYRRGAAQLMGKVEEVTKQLGVGMGAKALEQGETSAALAFYSADDNDKRIKSHKKALVKATEKTLPELFEGVKQQNALMARWMNAELLPWEAKVDELQPLQEAIKARIFNVELYAGLVETVKCVHDGKPAAMQEPLHLFQRRLYMDEECLANYEAGGMNFQKIAEFDQWLAKPQNLSRILPHPRCIAAFQVRRMNYDYGTECGNWQQFIQMAAELQAKRDADKWTFLYIRNGEQLFRLATEIDFDEKLFPDIDAQELGTGQLYASSAGRTSWIVISQHDYEVRRHELAKALWKYRADKRSAPARQKTKNEEFRQLFAPFEEEWKAWAKGVGSRSYGGPIKHPFKRLSDKPKADSWHDFGSLYTTHTGEPGPDIRQFRVSMPSMPPTGIKDFKPYSKGNVYWDDITKDLKDSMDRYNRVVLILQGLFDRSLALHPHPPVQLWNEESFRAHVRLVYDSDRTLVPGEAPDFEEYRRRLNASIKVGSIVTGQELLWEVAEAEKYNADSRRSRRHGENHYDKKRYSPPGNPGPGLLAKVVKVTRGKVHFEWLAKRHREWEPRGYYERERYRDLQQTSPLRKKFAVDIDKVFNVSNYTPGDFHMFFDDPRTRMDYAKWAPLMLVAEDFHAGKRKVQPDDAWMSESDY